ncbi:MAG TPA: hypothetical protein VGE17_09380, partial [Methylophilus sp.]
MTWFNQLRALALGSAQNTLAPRGLLWRKRCLWLLALLLTLTLFHPQLTLPNRVYDWYFVVDITQSMNV